MTRRGILLPAALAAIALSALTLSAAIAPLLLEWRLTQAVARRRARQTVAEGRLARLAADTAWLRQALAAPVGSLLVGSAPYERWAFVVGADSILELRAEAATGRERTLLTARIAVTPAGEWRPAAGDWRAERP